MKKIIDYEMSSDQVKAIINSGSFWFEHRKFSLGKTPQYHELIEEKDGRSKVAMRVYKNEPLHLTILKHIGFDLTRFNDSQPPPPPLIPMKEYRENIEERKKKLVERFEKNFGITKLDIVCFLKKSYHAIDEKDVDELWKIYSKIKNGVDPRKHFPIKNRNVGNFHWNTAIYPNFKTETSRVGGYDLDVIGAGPFWDEWTIFIISIAAIAVIFIFLLAFL